VCFQHLRGLNAVRSRLFNIRTTRKDTQFPNLKLSIKRKFMK
jgi:hypothetical protein